MRWFCIYKGMKGITKFSDLCYREENVITDIARRRAEIIDFFNEFGAVAACRAFKVKRSTIYRWKQLLKLGNGRLDALNNLSRAPIKKKESLIDSKIVEFIRETRKQWPRLSKKKLKPLLDKYCAEKALKTVSISTIGRIIKKHNMFYYVKKKKKHYNKNREKKLRRGDYKPTKAGDLVQIDTVVLFDFGIRRYLISAIDLVSRFSFSYCYKNPSSASAEDFMQKLDRVAPFSVKRVQTDNGSEFDKHFHQYIKDSGRIHYHNYPKSPKMNPYIERYNRTIQEEFTNVKDVDPYHDLDSFNRELMGFLLFYNTQRIHEGINNITPIAFLLSHLHHLKKSNMSWTYTIF